MTQPHHVQVGTLSIGNDQPLVLIAGPCALESRAHAQEMCHALTELTGKLGIGLIYKTSFDKANRTSLTGARGVGMAKGLPILAELRESFGRSEEHTSELQSLMRSTYAVFCLNT